MAFTVQWMTQVAEVGASQGMYDYLRGVVVFGPGPHQLHLKNVNTETWGTPVEIDEVPPRLLIPYDQRPNPGAPFTEMALGLVKNFPDPKDPPNLEAFIEAEEIVDDLVPYSDRPNPSSADVNVRPRSAGVPSVEK